MEKQEITPEEVKAPQEEVAKVDVTTEGKPRSKEKTLNIVLLVILFLLLVPTLSLIVAKSMFTVDQESVIVTEDCKCEECVEKECPVLEDGECKCPTLSATNPGWAIISVPELKVSIEVPDYTMVQELADQEVFSTWDTRLWQVDYKGYLYFGNYEKTLSSYLYPDPIPDYFGFPFKATIIDIHVFGNKSNLTLEQARDRYIEKFQEEEPTGTISGEIKTKWNERTYEFKRETRGGITEGSILVKNGKLYEITYSVSVTGDANRYSQRVINSIKFN